MTAYIGNKKISQEGDYGVYGNNKPVVEIYKGSNLIYRWNPFVPQEVVINSSTTEGITKTIELNKGYYEIEITGSGSSAYWYWIHIGNPSIAASDGGFPGASVHGTIQILKKASYTFIGAASSGSGGYGSRASGKASYLKCNDTNTDFIIANGGSGSNGTSSLTINTAYMRNVSLVQDNSSPHDWGKGASGGGGGSTYAGAGGNGGVYLKYIGQTI